MKTFLGIFCGLLMAQSAAAHRLAPLLLELHEEDSGQYRLAWQLPSSSAMRGIPPLRLPPACRLSEELVSTIVPTVTGTALRWSGEINCEDSTLAGEVFGTEGLGEGSEMVLLRVSFQNGKAWSRLLTAERPTMRLPADPSAWQAWHQYTLLGGEHILKGLDHLLFLLALLLLVQSTRSLIFTITFFTLGHSITLSLAALGVVSFSVNLVELGIAFSILVQAVELTKPVTKRSIFGRRPAFAAGLFGLLHGMGFAAALAETGLPVREVPVALLGFNLGVEIGQLVFIAMVLLAMACQRRIMPDADTKPLRLASIYTIGALAGLWCLERGALLFGLSQQPL